MERGRNREKVGQMHVGHNDRVRERMKWKDAHEQLDALIVAVIVVRIGSAALLPQDG